MSADLQTAPSPMETSDMRNDGVASQHVAAEESRFGQVRTAAVPTAGANNTQFTTTAVSREESGANYDSSDLDSSDDDHAEGEVTTAAGAVTTASDADAKKKEKEDKKRLEKEEKEKKKKEKAEKKEVKESSTKKAPPMPLEGHHYMVSEAPKPPAPITDDTPDHWYQVHQAKLKETAGAREEERKKELKAKKEETKGSVGYKLGKFFSNTSAAIGGTITGAQESHEVNVRDANIKQARARLAKYFPHEVGTENHFIIEFDCEAMHNNRPFKGHLLLTRNALLFVGKGNSANTTGLVVKEEISLKDIVSYAKGISVPCYEKDKRWVLDVPNNYIKPDAIQIFTSSGKGAMHYNFINITHPLKEFHDGHDEVSYYDRFLNFFDHAWRAAQ